MTLYTRIVESTYLPLIALILSSIITGCASSSVEVIGDSTQSQKWHGFSANELIQKLPAPESVTDLPAGGKTYRWARTETVETLSYSNYKRSVQATCIFQVTTASDTTIKSVTHSGHDQVCQYFTDRL